MSHTIKKSLAGTSMQYVVDDENEGLRVRKLSDNKLRIHIEKKAPSISSRSRLDGYDVPYWAMDVNTKGLLRAIDLATGGVVADAPEEQVVPKLKGFESTLAQVVVEIDQVDAETVPITAKIKEFEKAKEVASAKKKKLLGLRQRLSNGMVAYRDAQEFLGE